MDLVRKLREIRISNLRLVKEISQKCLQVIYCRFLNACTRPGPCRENLAPPPQLEIPAGPCQGCGAPPGALKASAWTCLSIYLPTICLTNKLISHSLFLIFFPFFSSFSLFFSLNFALFLFILGRIFQMWGSPWRGALGPGPMVDPA